MGAETSIDNFTNTGLVSGQAKIATTGTAVQLSSSTTPLQGGLLITAKPSNLAPIEVGLTGVNNTIGGAGNGYILEAGASVSVPIAQASLIYINGTANDYVSFIGN